MAFASARSLRGTQSVGRGCSQAQVGEVEAAKAAAEHWGADLRAKLTALQSEKAEQDEYLAEFEAASLDEAEVAVAKLAEVQAEYTATHAAHVEELIAVDESSVILLTLSLHHY